MAANLPNALLRPAEGPNRFSGAPGASVMGGRQLPLGALRIPNPLTSGLPAPPQVPPVPAVPVGLPPGTIPQVALEDRISPRVPVPKGDFPEGEHKRLHEEMGEHFDDPGAQKFVHDLYNLGRKLHPDIHPRHLLETTRDSFHAWRHGFMPAEYVGRNLATMARQRQRAAERLARTVAPEPEGATPQNTQTE